MAVLDNNAIAAVRPIQVRGLLAGWLATAFLLVTLVCMLVPFSPVMPGSGLDLSWIFAMNQAEVEGLSFGKAIVFTFGPYSGIYTHLYHPASDLMIMVASGYLAFSYWLATALLLRNSRWPLTIVAVLIWLSAEIYLTDSLFLAYPLVAGLAGLAIFDPRFRACRFPLPIIALLFAPFGLLLLIKGSMIMLIGVIVVICCLYFLNIGKFAAAVLSVVAPLLSTIGFWVWSGQRMDGLPDYFVSMVPIVSGYTEAMASNGFLHELILYLLLALLLLLSIARAKAILAKYAILLITAIYLFVLFKAGFVRQDGHVIIAADGLLLGSFFVALFMGSQQIAKNQLLLILASTFFWMLALITHSINSDQIKAALLNRGVDMASWQHESKYSQAIHAYDVLGPESLLHLSLGAVRFPLPYVRAWQGIEFRLREKNALADKLSLAMQSLKKEAGFPMLSGTTDIYSYDQSYLIASGNTWDPRPVLQSYSVYMPSLVEMNRQHLLGLNAPDNIIFRVQPIDNRMPSMEDGASWPALLTRYHATMAKNGYLFLRKRQALKPVEVMPVMSQAAYRFGEQVMVAQLGKPVFAAIDVEPTLLGRIMGMLYKPPILQITLHLENGQIRQYRIISGMAKTGFLLSPLIENTAQFALLYSGISTSSMQAVKSFKVQTVSSNDGLWKERYSVIFKTMD